MNKISFAILLGCIPALIAGTGHTQPEEQSAVEALLALASEYAHNPTRCFGYYRRAFLEDPRDARPLIGMAVEHRRRGDAEAETLCLLEAHARGLARPFLGFDQKSLAARLARVLPDPEGEPSGRVARCRILYLGFAPPLGPRHGPGSVEVGGRLNPAALLVQGYDESGRRVPFVPRFSVSSGLTLTEGEPPAIRAGAKASREEWVQVSPAAGTDVHARTPIRVVGPAARLRFGVYGRSVDPGDTVAARPGETIIAGVRVEDAAGTRLYRPRLAWTAFRGEDEEDPSLVRRRTTIREPGQFFEPHRNWLVVPPASADRAGPVRLVATDPLSGVRGRLEVRIDPRAKPVPSPETRMTFFTGSLEEALASARKDGKIVFAVFAARWCPFCRRTFRRDLSDERVRAAVEAHVRVWVDVDERRDLVSRYQIRDLPRLLLIDPDLGVLGLKKHDYRTGIDAVLAFARSAESRRRAARRALREIAVEIATTPDSADGYLKLGNLHYRAVNLAKADAAYERALAHLGEERAKLPRQVELMQVYIRVLRREHADGLKRVQEFLASHADTPEEARARYYRGYLLYDAGRYDEARAVFAALTEDHPRSRWSHAARGLLQALSAGRE